MTDTLPRDHAGADNDDAVGFVLRLARAMQAYGYPAHRVEGALGEVARRLGLTAQFFSTPTSFMASFGALERQRTHLIRVEPGDVDLGKSADVEEIIREVLEGRATPAQGSADLERVHSAPQRYGAFATVLAFGVSSSAASRFLGGGLREALVAGVIGLAIGLLGIVAGRLRGLGRVFPFLAAFSASAIAAAAATVLPHYSVYVGTLAGLIVLIPGLTLTTAMTELSSGHLASGTARLSGALMLFLVIGFGVAIGSQMVTLVLGEYASRVRPELLPDWTWWLALVGAPLGFTVLFRAHARDAIWILLAGALGIAGSRVGSAAFGPELGAFVGALSVGVASNAYAYLLRRPASVTLVPGILLLVPGAIGFRSLSSLLDREVITGVETAFTMVLIAAGLVAGLLLANVLVPQRRPA
jgi:uncharacterized membrane protein YjjP (DUF1212 family)